MLIKLLPQLLYVGELEKMFFGLPINHTLFLEEGDENVNWEAHFLRHLVLHLFQLCSCIFDVVGAVGGF